MKPTNNVGWALIRTPYIVSSRMQLWWILQGCLLPTVSQGTLICLPMMLCALLLRLCVLWDRLHKVTLNTFAAALGLYVLWLYYGGSVVYFMVLCVLVYFVLRVVRRRRGVAVGAVSLAFIASCEIFFATASDWHKVRGSFLVMVMKMVSLGFDLEEQRGRGGERKPPVLYELPDFINYTSYCVFPATTIFGPFVTFDEHCKFLRPSPLSWSWLVQVLRSLLSSIVCLGISVCVAPFLFSEPEWNKWFAAYSAAASFRYSHYFVSFLSECSTLAAGIGYQPQPHGSLTWSSFRVVHPLAIELPRSLGMVVTHWNLPMHLFLKNYVFKPARLTVGRFGAILMTYFSSALLHGLNFQLAAVLLSIGIYAYIESVFRYKLSERLDACVLDRPCPEKCNHRHKKAVSWVFLLNAGFTLLAMFHLAYLGLMFGGQSEEEASLEIQGYSMMHTLRKWAHLDFLSHWVAMVTYLVSRLL